MNARAPRIVFIALVCGIAIGLGVPRLAELLPAANAQQPARPVPAAPKKDADSAGLVAEVERLKKTVPDQSHVMHDVEYHFANLWFAATNANWPLADFYLSETKSHLRWAVRIIPVRKDSSGNPVKLEDILQAVENGPLKQLAEAVKAQDNEKFQKAYAFMLEACYSCHKASSKPYLRPQIPERSAAVIINMNPQADWPK